MKTCVCSIALAIIVMVLYQRDAAQQISPVMLILDTDISSDVDDVGAVAVLHTLEKQGKAKILAMMVSSGDMWSVSCLGALNTWFGHPDIPIGIVQGESVEHPSLYTEKIASEFSSGLRKDTSGLDAVALYREILAGHEDKSVVLVTVGYLTNLSNLLQSKADQFSSLEGKALVLKKVKQLICMGGEYPRGREWNFYQDTKSTEYVVKHWPTPVILCGYEVGRKVLTGAALKSVAVKSPVRRAYQLYNEITDRPSWDQLTVLYAVEKSSNTHSLSWRISAPGKISIDKDGANRWIHDSKGLYRYLRLDTSPEKTATTIDQLMAGTFSK